MEKYLDWFYSSLQFLQTLYIKESVRRLIYSPFYIYILYVLLTLKSSSTSSSKFFNQSVRFLFTFIRSVLLIILNCWFNVAFVFLIDDLSMWLYLSCFLLSVYIDGYLLCFSDLYELVMSNWVSINWSYINIWRLMLKLWSFRCFNPLP